MVAQLLVSHNRAATPRIGYTTGASFTQIGDSLPDQEDGLSVNIFSTSRVINVFGRAYAMHYDGVYRLQTGSNYGSWSKELADGGIDFTNFPTLGNIITAGVGQAHGGIYFGLINEEPHIFGWIWSETVGRLRPWRLNLLTDVPDVGSQLNTGAGADNSGNEILFNGQIYWRYGVFDRYYVINPVGLTIAQFTSNAQPTTWTGNDMDWDIFNNQLYLLSRTGVTPTLYEMVSGETFGVVTLPGGANSGNSRPLLFNDGTSLYCVYYNTSTSDWEMHQINFVNGQPQLGTDLTNIVLPASIIGSGVNSRLWATKVYNDDGTTDILIYHAPGTASPFSQYRWAGNNSALIPEDIGGTLISDFAVPNQKTGSGERTYNEESPTITVYDRSRDAGGERITFRVHPPINPGPSSVTEDLIVRFFWGTGGGAPETPAQLVGTATGGSAMRNGNQVEGVDADDTDYTVVIQATGFNDLDKIELVARVSSS